MNRSSLSGSSPNYEQTSVKRKNLRTALTEFKHLVCEHADIKIYALLDVSWDGGVTSIIQPIETH